METLLTIFCLLGICVILAFVFRSGPTHINVECLPLKAYEIICNAGGSLPEEELVRRLGERIDPQRVRLFQTFAGKAREVVRDLLETGCVARSGDGLIAIVKPMTFVNSAGRKREEFSLDPSGRGMACRHYSGHDR